MEVDEEQVENPLTAAFWINLVLVIIGIIVVSRLTFIASSYEIAGSSLRGMGKSLTPALMTVFGTCLLRMVWVYVVSPIWRGYDVLMTVYPVSWVVTGLMVLTAYWLTIRKKTMKA